MKYFVSHFGKFVLAACSVFCLFSNSQCQNPTIVFEQPINEIEGGGIPDLSSGDWFGYAVAPIGDLDQDGIQDLAVGAPYDDDGGLNRGALYILFMTSNATVGSYQKISQLQGGFQGLLVDESFFGSDIANVGDLDGNGVQDLVVGASGDDDGGSWAGAVWVLFMNADGTVSNQQKISALAGWIGSPLSAGDRFGKGVDSIGDLNSDGVIDIIVGAHEDDDGGTNHGAAYVVFLNSDGTVQSNSKISEITPGFIGNVTNSANFGWSVACLGDVNSDGNTDLLIGAMQDDVLGTDDGSAWIVSVTSSGQLTGCVEISGATSPILASIISSGDKFGSSVTRGFSMWCDDANDIIVGAMYYGNGSEGGVLLVDINSNFQVEHVQAIAEGMANFQDDLNASDRFGRASHLITDYDGNGFPDLMVGAIGFGNSGGTWILSLQPFLDESVLPDTVFGCVNSQISLYPSMSLDNIAWSTGESSDTIIVGTQGQIWVDGTLNGCLVSDTTEVVSNVNPSISLGSDTIVCDGLDLSVSVPGFNILWSTGDQQSGISVTQSGSYWVQASSPCGLISDTISIEVHESLNNIPIADTVICGAIQLLLEPQFDSGQAASLIWNDASIGNSLQVMAPGTYWYTASNFCSTISDTITILQESSPNIYLPSDTMSCGPMTIDVSVPGYSVLWNTGQTSAEIEISETGSYTASWTGVCGTFTEEFNVNILTQPVAGFFTRSKPVEFIDPSVQFINESTGAIDFEWHFGDDHMSYEENPEHSYDTSGVYLVMLIAYGSDNACVDTAFGYIEVDPMVTIYVPNAFTPDGDGVNDTWGAKGFNFDPENFELEVFDRWGGLIWRTDNPKKWWDGTYMDSNRRVKQGLYVYQFKFRYFNTFVPKVLKGTVTLYRHN